MNTQLRVDSVTIANNGNASDGVLNLGDGAIVGIVAETAWTAAVLSFSVSWDGITFYPVYDSNGNEVSLTVAAGTYVSISPPVLPAVQRIKIRSGTVATPVTQLAARTIRVFSRQV